jgi:ketosteroid isomerase-like protein
VVSENVASARRAWEAFNRRDYETQLSFIHPDLEWRPAQGPGGPEGTIYRGREEYERWIHEEVVPVWESFRGEDLASASCPTAAY